MYPSTCTLFTQAAPSPKPNKWHISSGQSLELMCHLFGENIKVKRYWQDAYSPCACRFLLDTLTSSHSPKTCTVIGNSKLGVGECKLGKALKWINMCGKGECSVACIEWSLIPKKVWIRVCCIRLFMKPLCYPLNVCSSSASQQS